MMLVIDRKESVIRYRARCVMVEQPGKGIRRIPLKQLEHLVVYGNPLIEAGVWRALATAGIPSVMLPGRGNSEAAMLGPGLATQLPVRRAQHHCADVPLSSLTMAQWFVGQKLGSYDLPIHLLMQLSRCPSASIGEFLHKRNEAVERLGGCADLNSTLGLEGNIAKAWFSLLAQCLPRRWKFLGRNRRPPRDPCNALLSLGYTILHSEIRQVLVGNGFDLSLGFLHQPYPGRESLVLDFLEIFRSGVDCFVIGLLIGKKLDRHCFYYRKEEGCRLSKAARPLFYDGWADQLDSWPRPQNPAGQSGGEWPVAPLREQIGGQAALARELLRDLTQGEQDEPASESDVS